MRSHKWKIPEARSAARARVFANLIAALILILSVWQARAGSMSEHSARLTTLRGKLGAAEEEIKGLIQAKAHSDDPAHLKGIVDAMAERHKEYTKLAKDYRELELHVRFKHPDQYEADQALEKKERRYTRFQVKTLKELEGEVGADGRLDRIKARVLATFPAPEADAPPKPEPKIHPHFRKPASEDGSDEPERIKLVK